MQWQPVEVLVDLPTSLPDTSTVFDPAHYADISAQLLEYGWCPNTEARNAQHQHVAPESEDAVEWCVIGSFKAAIKYMPQEMKPYALQYLRTAWNAANPMSMLDDQYEYKHNDKLAFQPHEVAQAHIVKMMRRVVEYFHKHPEANTWGQHANRK